MAVPVVAGAAIGIYEVIAAVGAISTGFFTWLMYDTVTDSVETLAMPLISSAVQDEPEKDETQFESFAGIVSTGLAVVVVYAGYVLVKKVVKSF